MHDGWSQVSATCTQCVNEGTLIPRGTSASHGALKGYKSYISPGQDKEFDKLMNEYRKPIYRYYKNNVDRVEMRSVSQNLL